MAASNVYTFVTTEKLCVLCAGPFAPQTGGRTQRFCSPPCRIAYHKERYRREPHRCPLCGAEHEPLELVE